jgi:hypothetical protein
MCPGLAEVDCFGVAVTSGGVCTGLVAGARGVLACVRRTLVAACCELLQGGPIERSFVHRADLARRTREVHPPFLRRGLRAVPGVYGSMPHRSEASKYAFSLGG